MVSQLQREISNVIRDVFLERDNEKLAYSHLYKQVVEKLAVVRKRDIKISYRDYSLILDYMVKERNLIKEDSGKRGGRVYYSLTAGAIKEHQHDILGINPDKERRRKLYQLLFIYEIAKYGQMIFTNERFDNLPKLAQWPKEDLKITKQLEILDGNITITIFEPINGIEISRYEYKQTKMTSYSVIYPGFSIKEILSFHNKNSRLSYSYYYPRMFGHIQFTLDDLMKAFKELKNADLIRPISIFAGDQDVNISARLRRYTIADNRVKQLIYDVWKIYGELQTILFMKYSIGELEDKEGNWLNYLFGITNTEKIIQNWKSNQSSILKYGNEYDKDIEITKIKGIAYRWLAELKQRFSDLNKKYSHVIQEYNFPLNPINEILTPAV